MFCPGRLAQGDFLSVLDNLYIQEESVMEKSMISKGRESIGENVAG